MKHTVKQVARMSGVSVRTLHFYDETGLLKPARHALNGYRLYEEPQLLMLQQILFYRELGFELKQIKAIVDRADFEKAGALQSHRKVLEEKVARTNTLIATIDKTMRHLKGKKKMRGEEMFIGFRVPAGKARFGENIRLGGQEPNDCKLSTQDTEGAMCVFEFTGASGGPRHLHHEQDEWIYIVDGDFNFEVGDKTFRAGPGESVFLPRNVPHVWACVSAAPGKIINVYQPAGKMEEFFRALGKYDGKPYVHEALSFDQFRQFFHEHGMKVVGPPLVGKWKIEDGRMIHIA
jgi:DNA-binding transcriptional MerR regulator/quercetin dioxygenase-like cupin family protein